MFGFLFKGVLRDKTRSTFPLLIISAGVMITIVVYSWLNGFIEMTIQENARFDTGHIKITTRAYSEMSDQKPYDLGLVNFDPLIDDLKNDYPEIIWLPRIYFGGLIDLPDIHGETKAQSEIYCLGVNLLTGNEEISLLNLRKALIRGRLPSQKKEILVSNELVEKMKIPLGSQVTIISSTMMGSFTMGNFKVTGTVKFGIRAMDRGTAILDLNDSQSLLDMEEAAGEILGLRKEYNRRINHQISENFNRKFSNPDDEFSPVMIPLSKQNNLKNLLQVIDERKNYFIFVFIFIMSLVLWNSGLMNGIRRYGEIGLRLAIGENKHHIYFAMLMEALFVGLIGSMIGSILGLGISYLFQYKGIDTSALLKEATILMSTNMKAKVSIHSYYIGLIPGVGASLLGAAFSGIGIYRRKTSELFKELET